MFRTPYLVRIKVLIINQLKMFYSPFSSGSQPSLLFSSSNFLVNLLPTSVYSTYKPLILDGFLEILVSLSWFCKNGYKNSLFSLWLLQIFGEQGRWVFIPYNFSYLHLGPISFKGVTFALTSFSSYN